MIQVKSKSDLDIANDNEKILYSGNWFSQEVSPFVFTSKLSEVDSTSNETIKHTLSQKEVCETLCEITKKYAPLKIAISNQNFPDAVRLSSEKQLENYKTILNALIAIGYKVDFNHVAPLLELYNPENKTVKNTALKLNIHLFIEDWCEIKKVAMDNLELNNRPFNSVNTSDYLNALKTVVCVKHANFNNEFSK